MSNQGYSDPSQGNHNFQSNNPYSHPTTSGSGPPSYGGAPQQQQPGTYAPQQQQHPPQQHSGGYAPPAGPPPGQQPRRAGTFKETDFVPETERGEQREAIQQFEMNKSGNESQQDRDVAQLGREFPGVDGSLISALYSDTGSLGSTREMLQELAGASAQQGH